MELAALTVAVLAFGWAVLLVGAPLFVGTLVVLAVVRLWELVRSRLERRRATRWDEAAALPEGLMSGFFAVSAIPEQPLDAAGRAAGPAHRARLGRGHRPQLGGARPLRASPAALNRIPHREVRDPRSEPVSVGRAGTARRSR